MPAPKKPTMSLVYSISYIHIYTPCYNVERPLPLNPPTRWALLQIGWSEDLKQPPSRRCFNKKKCRFWVSLGDHFLFRSNILVQLLSQVAQQHLSFDECYGK